MKTVGCLVIDKICSNCTFETSTIQIEIVLFKSPHVVLIYIFTSAKTSCYNPDSSRTCPTLHTRYRILKYDRVYKLDVNKNLRVYVQKFIR